MTRAPQEKRKLDRSPLVLVLTEVRFAPILSMSSLVPAVQDALRRSGFPGFSTSLVHQFQIGVNAEPTLQAAQRWAFTSKDGASTVTLTTEAMSIQTTSYVDFETFLDLVRGVVEVLQKVAEPSYADRVGLRYVDAVPDVGARLSDYFNETVLSFSAEELGVKSLLSSQHILAETDYGHLQIRMNQLENAPLLPPDLLSPELSSISAPRPGIHALLDIDSSDESRSDFQWEVLEQRLWNVHTPASSAFWKSITDNARTVWEERSVDQ